MGVTSTRNLCLEQSKKMHIPCPLVFTIYMFECVYITWIFSANDFIIMPVLPGLLPLRRIVSKGEYELRVDLEDFEGEVRYAKYSGFSIGSSASNYTLEAVGYLGDAGT